MTGDIKEAVQKRCGAIAPDVGAAYCGATWCDGSGGHPATAPSYAEVGDARTVIYLRSMDADGRLSAFTPRLRVFGRRCVRNAAHADAVTQEVLLCAHRQLGSLHARAA